MLHFVNSLPLAFFAVVLYRLVVYTSDTKQHLIDCKEWAPIAFTDMLPVTIPTTICNTTGMICA